MLGATLCTEKTREKRLKNIELRNFSSIHSDSFGSNGNVSNRLTKQRTTAIGCSRAQANMKKMSKICVCVCVCVIPLFITQIFIIYHINSTICQSALEWTWTTYNQINMEFRLLFFCHTQFISIHRQNIFHAIQRNKSRSIHYYYHDYGSLSVEYHIS